MKRNLELLSLLCLVLFLFSCTKLKSDITETGSMDKTTAGVIPNSSPTSNTYVDSFDAVNHDGDSTETMTALGNQLTNPYLIPNMQQAYANLGITNVSVTVTHKYIRFKPTVSQVSYLDSFMNAKSLELFDAPLDYQILREGDYYQDPSIPAEQPTWQYAVVQVNFTFPSGVQNETLAQIHIPGDNYTAVETEAERLAESGGGGTASATDGGAQPNMVQCTDGYHWDSESRTCVPNNCPTGYHWDGTQCVPDQTSPTPPSPAADAAVPSGQITLDETQQLTSLTTASPTYNTVNGTYNKLTPLQNAHIIARRWFKVERVYTNAAGQFQFTKRFKHKVRITVKFENSDATLRCLRGVRVWNTLFAVSRVIGVYYTNKNAINYNFAQFDYRRAKGNVYWVAGTVHNGVQEYKTLAGGQSIGLPPAKMYILLTNWAINAATPMLHQRWSDYLPADAVKAWMANDPTEITGGLTAILNVVVHDVDMTYGFLIKSDAPNTSFFTKESDKLKETIYHELTHAAHYNKLGLNWYSQFVNAEISAISDAVIHGNSPYGDGTASYSPIIALGESWAYYMGHFMADLKYGLKSSQANEQSIGYVNNSPVSGLSSHINLLEDFSPFRTSDPFYWIPQGL